jgi:formylglycine-generating enzyme required for sulfatase activity
MGNHPQVCVDWCDAHAYCKGVGKRLCGKIGGGPNGYADYADTSKSEWMNACSSGGKHLYSYGDTYQGATCNGQDMGLGTTKAVGTCPGCVSPEVGYSGVNDLGGNAVEWDDSCNGTAGNQDLCRARGGSFLTSGVDLRCDFGLGLVCYRDLSNIDVGFRCCSSP